MNKVDNRTVELGFENRDFEKGIRDSSRSLADFDKALRNSGNGSAFSGLSGIVDGVTGKFSVFGTMAVGALMKIGSQAVVMGQQLINSFAIQPITAGFNEYELKINSIKTMLASGKTAEGLPVTLEQVNKELEVLNQYADQTIYSFSDMTSNIGKFTNAGVDLETSVQAIKGIANAAALSGASSAEASRAMYNFSQALSSGYVKLIDWKSIENANMATVEFKTQLLESAVAAGTLEKQADGMYKVLSSGKLINATNGFNESLQDQWMTTEALTKTLNDYADETTEIGKKATEAATKVRTWSQLIDTTKEALQSGWAVTFENIFGNYDEATEIFTGLSNVIGEIVGNSADARNQLLGDWKELGGRQAIIDGLVAAWDALSTTMGWVKEAFREVFPPLTAETLVKISEGFRDLMTSLKPSTKTLMNLRIVFQGLFSAFSLGFKLIGSVFKGIFNGIKNIVSVLPKGDGLLGFLSKIGLFFNGLRTSAESGKVFEKISLAISNAIGWLADKIKSVIEIFKESTFISTTLETLKETFSNWKVNLGGFETLSTIITKIKDAFIGFFENIIGFSDKVDGVISPIEKLTKVNTEGIDNLKEKLNGFFGPIKEKLAPLGEFLLTIFNKIKNFLKQTWETEGLDGFIKILGTLFAGGLAKKLGDFIGALTGIGKEGQNVVKGVSGFFDSLKSTLKAYQESLNSKKLLMIAGAIGILAASLLVITMLDQTKLAAGVGVITALFVDLSAAMATGSKWGKDATKAAKSMMLISAAVLIISFALSKLEGVDPKAIWALTIVIAELVAASLLLSDMKDFKSSAVGLLGLAGSIKIIAKSVKIFGAMDPAQLTQGMIAVSILITELAGFVAIINTFGGNGSSILAAGVAIGIIAIALLELSGVVAILGKFKIETLVKGLGSLAVLMAIVALGMSAMSNPSVLAGAAAMIITAAAMTLFVPAIVALGSLPLKTIGIGLLAMAGIFTVVGVAGLVLGPITPLIIALAGALFIFGAAALAIGTGMALLGTGLAVLSTVGAAAITVLVAAIVGIASTIPLLMTAVAKGIILMAKVITDGAPVIAGAIISIFTNFISLVTVEFPKVIEAIFSFITLLLTKLLEKVPEFVDAGMKIILGFLKGISDNIQSIVETVMQMIVNILNGIAEKLPDLITAGANIIIAFLQGIGEQVPRVVDAAFQMIIDFINGLADSIRENTPLLLAAVGNLCTAFIDGVLEFFGISGGTSTEGQGWASSILQGLIDGLGAGISGVVTAVQTVGQNIISGFKDLFNINSPSKVMEDLGVNIVDGLDEGLRNSDIDAVKATEDIMIKMVLVVTQSIQKFKEGGMLISIGIAEGIKESISFTLNAFQLTLDLVITKINSFLPIMKRKAFEIIDQIILGISNTVKMAQLGDTILEIMAFIVELIELQFAAIILLGQALVENFITGLRDSKKRQQIADAAGLIMRSALTAMGDQRYKNMAVTVGQGIGDGVIRGINNRADNIVQAGTQLALRLIRAVMDYLGESSPSKVFAEIGEYIDLGLVDGINGYSNLVMKSAEQLGQDSIDGLKSVMSQISDAVSMEINSDPVIRPVLDLTGVKSGANDLNSIIAGSSYNLAASKLIRDRSMIADRQNGSNLFDENRQVIKNEFNLYGVTVRSEADIDKIAEQLYHKQENAMRLRGMKPSYA